MSLESLALVIRDHMQRNAQAQRSAANAIGISPVTLWQLLQGRAMPTPRTRARLAKWLGVPGPHIMGIINGAGGIRTAMAYDPVAVAIHKAGPIARTLALAAIDAEKRYANPKPRLPAQASRSSSFTQEI
jgi:transcriptional regulator with XRE-family HTH domain